MIHCKRHIIAAGFMLILPLAAWPEAPVVDDSDNFAIVDDQQAREASVAAAQYEEPQVALAQNDKYQLDGYPDDEGPALAHDDQAGRNPRNNNVADNAALIDKIQSLQREVQELRGQLEIQAHDLKLLQQQQTAFYKDLDTRIGSGNTSIKSTPAKPTMDLSLDSPNSATQANVPAKNPEVAKTANPGPAAISVSRANPADEQIGYLAAYELIKNKRYDDALTAMNTFVQKYPRGGYTANAHYWLGELYLVKKDYAQAVDHFNIVLEQFPTSSKSAASMLKVGYAYAAMGNKPEAKKFLQQVVRAYPNTPTAQLASSKLQTI